MKIKTKNPQIVRACTSAFLRFGVTLALGATVSHISNVNGAPGVSDDPSWEFTGQDLSSDDVTLTIRLQPKTFHVADQDLLEMFKQRREVRAILSTASPVITYGTARQIEGANALRIDFNDQAELDKIRKAIVSFPQYCNSLDAVNKQFDRGTPRWEEGLKKAMIEFEKSARQYDGILGEKVVQYFYEDQGQLSYITFGPKGYSGYNKSENDPTIRKLYEPEAFLFLLNHVSELREIHTNSIAAKQKRQLAIQKAELDKIRAKSLERLKRTEAQNAQKLAAEALIQERARFIAVMAEKVDSDKLVIEKDHAAKALIHAQADLAFLQAAKRGDLEGMKNALQSGANINAKTTNRHETALMIAIENGNNDILTFLLGNHINVNAVDNLGRAA